MIATPIARDDTQRIPTTPKSVGMTRSFRSKR